MSGYTSHRNRSANGKSDSRMKYTNGGSRKEWKPKTKIATDGSLGSASCCLKDNSPLIGECTSGKMSSFSPKPALDVSSQQESLLPLVKDVASGMENLKLMPNSCQRADNGLKHLGSVSASDYRLKDSPRSSSQLEPSYMQPITAKSQKGTRSDTATETDSTTGSKSKDSTLSSLSEPSYKHSCASKGQTGRRSDMVAETHNDRSSLVNMYATLTKPSPAACFSLDDGIPEKEKQFGDISQEKAGSSGGLEDDVCVSPIMRFDICPKRSNLIVKLKAPLHVKNKEKRNQIKRCVEGHNIIVLRPGMVLMKGYISSDDQISIVKACRELGISDGGFYQPDYRHGSTLHLKMMCLGKNWDPDSSRYSDTRPVDNAKPPGIPDKFHDMVKRAIQDSNAHIQENFAKVDEGNIIPSLLPDICIVNFYAKGGKLGLHQDKDESAESLNRGLPVVSFSIGDSAEFLYGEVRDIDKADKVILESGDVLIFGGKARRIFHGVASILPDTAPMSLVEATDLRPGRLNLTFRQF